MNASGSGVKGWAQASILPPEHVRIEVTLHWAADTGTKQLGVSITDHITEQQIAIWTKEISPVVHPARLALVVADELARQLSEHCHPF